MEWRRLHDEELYNLYLSPRIIQVIKSRIMGWAGHVARVGDSRGALGVFVGRPEGKKTLGRPRCRWEYNSKMDLQEGGWGETGLVRLRVRERWRALVNPERKLRVP